MNIELVNTFFEMVQISSESGEEKEFISYLEDLLTKKLQAKCIIDDYGNLIAKIPAKYTARTEPIFFGVHADTVRPGKDIEPVLENGVIRSAGDTILGADDKAGIAELFEAIEAAERHSPLEIVVSREEEIGLLGSKNLDASFLNSKMGFVVDMDNLADIVIGGPSYMTIDVDIIGRAAHAGMEPEKGVSSIKVAADAISKLKQGWIDKETTVNVGVIQGGEIRNSVPEKTEIKIECRSQSNEKCLKQSDFIREVFVSAAKAVGARAEVRMELAVKAYRISDGAESVKVAQRAVSSVGLNPTVKSICGGTDAAHYNERGIETVVIGMGAKAEHTKEENIAVVDMEKAVRIIREILEALSK